MPRDESAVRPIHSTAQLQAAYVGAFDLYASEPSEAALHVGYELGRRAVELGVSVPELARIHHAALRMVLGAPGVPDDETVVHRAADFLAECLSAFEMIRRGYSEAHERAQREHRHAAVLRRLSSLLADTSLALDRAGSVSEVLTLVAEAARELTGAQYCSATLYASRGSGRPLMVASGVRLEDSHELIADLAELTGRKVGSLTISSDDTAFSELDHALLMQLAEMAAAALERARLYG